MPSAAHAHVLQICAAVPVVEPIAHALEVGHLRCLHHAIHAGFHSLYKAAGPVRRWLDGPGSAHFRALGNAPRMSLTCPLRVPVSLTCPLRVPYVSRCPLRVPSSYVPRMSLVCPPMVPPPFPRYVPSCFTCPESVGTYEAPPSALDALQQPLRLARSHRASRSISLINKYRRRGGAVGQLHGQLAGPTTKGSSARGSPVTEVESRARGNTYNRNSSLASGPSTAGGRWAGGRDNCGAGVPIAGFRAGLYAGSALVVLDALSRPPSL